MGVGINWFKDRPIGFHRGMYMSLFINKPRKSNATNSKKFIFIASITLSLFVIVAFQNCQNSTFCSNSDVGCTGNVAISSRIDPVAAPEGTQSQLPTNTAFRIEYPTNNLVTIQNSTVREVRQFDGLSFQLVPIINGGTLPYKFQWQVKVNNAGSSADNTNWVNVDADAASSTPMRFKTTPYLATQSSLILPTRPGSPNIFRLIAQENNGLGATLISNDFKVIPQEYSQDCSGDYFWIAAPNNAAEIDKKSILEVFNLYFSNGAAAYPRYLISVNHPLAKNILTKYKGKSTTDPNNIALKPVTISALGYGGSRTINCSGGASIQTSAAGTTSYVCEYNKIRIVGCQ